MAETLDDGATDPMRNTSPLLVAEEAARYLRMSTLALQRLRWQGLGPNYARHGSYIRYSLPELDSWIQTITAPGSLKAADRCRPHAKKAVGE